MGPAWGANRPRHALSAASGARQRESLAGTMSPTQRTLKRLRDAGYLAYVVERWIPGAKIRSDLFGFVDVLALRDGEILGVQTTTGSNVNARIAKITEHENVAVVRKAGIRIEVDGWRKNAAGRWVVRTVDLS
jgi:hypothetical protein